MVKRWVKNRIMLPAGLAVLFVLVFYTLMATAPESKRRKTEYVAPLVEIMELKRGTHDITVQAQGLVMPAQQEVTVRPQVGGMVVALHPNYEPGGVIPAGETILEIEAADYEIALKEAEARLARAKAAVALEKGQQQIAKEEFELLEGDFQFDEMSRSLALRQPQLEQFEAELAIAETAYNKAKLNLARTRLALPYEAMVLETSAAVGELVSAGTEAGTFARADKFWVELRVQQKHLSRLHAKTHEGGGSSVTIFSNGYEYKGEVVGLRANLVSETRMGGAIVEVQNPLYGEKAGHLPPLLIGSHVKAELDAGTIDGAFEIPRSALLDNRQVYVVDGNQQLRIREANVLWELPDTLIIEPSLALDDALVVSRVAGIAPGAEVRTRFPKEILAEDSEEVKSASDNENAGR